MIYGDAATVMALWPADSFGAVVTSPPYNIGVDYGAFHDDLSPAEYFDFTAEWVEHALRVAPVVVVNFGAPTSDPLRLAHFMCACAEVGQIQAHIAWVKSIATKDWAYGHFKPVNSKRYLNNVWESVFVISRDGNYKLDRHAVGVPFKDKSNIARFASNSKDVRCRGNVWFVPYETKNIKDEHPAAYPAALAELMIRLVAPVSVLDPFAGSGTTLAVASAMGIPSEGIDIRPWS